MATFGGVTCSIIKRCVATGPKARVSHWWVPGLAGHGSQALGSNDSAFSFDLHYMSTLAACNTWQLSIEALQGTVCTATDSDGIAYTKLHVLKVDARPVQPWRVPGSAVTARRIIRVSGVIRP